MIIVQENRCHRLHNILLNRVDFFFLFILSGSLSQLSAWEGDDNETTLHRYGSIILKFWETSTVNKLNKEFVHKYFC